MVSENLKIEIRPIPNRNNIREFAKNLEYYSQAHIIAPLVDPVTLKYKTGLTEEDKKYLVDKGFPYNIDDTFRRGVPHEFWESGLVKVELRNNPMFLYPGKSLIDFIKWKYLLVNSFIYSSEAEMQKGNKPQATHFIYNEDEENTIKATKIERTNKLITAVSKLSLAKKRNLILILNNENTDNKDENYLSVKLNDIISSPRRAELEVLLENSDSDIEVKSILKNAVRKNVIRKTRKGYFYFETNLGLTENDVTDFLQEETNQEILLTIKSKI